MIFPFLLNPESTAQEELEQMGSLEPISLKSTVAALLLVMKDLELKPEPNLEY